MTMGRVVDQAFAALAPAVAAGHVGRGARLVQEDEALAVHEALEGPPALPVAGHVRSVPRVKPEGRLCSDALRLFFYMRQAEPTQHVGDVESAFTSIPSVGNASHISLSVIPGLLVAIDRNVLE